MLDHVMYIGSKREWNKCVKDWHHAEISAYYDRPGFYLRTVSRSDDEERMSVCFTRLGNEELREVFQEALHTVTLVAQVLVVDLDKLTEGTSVYLAVEE